MADNPARNTRSKRHRPEPPNTEDVLKRAREIWSRNPNKARATASEDSSFREFFGCGVLVFLSLWNMLDRFDLIPPEGRFVHLLWTVMFLKVYANCGPLCALAGGVDPNTYMKWVWLFMDAIVELESHVVSCFRPRCTYQLHV